ncbi:hypothetical protein T06_6010 [Trichinella sp. T6]|nr:hypothetical protein T06_6010 [Trichinella sp. T6]KRZ94621.1 hypothetical protein T08_3644 [Trichinella sp. T8]
MSFSKFPAFNSNIVRSLFHSNTKSEETNECSNNEQRGKLRICKKKVNCNWNQHMAISQNACES